MSTFEAGRLILPRAGGTRCQPVPREELPLTDVVSRRLSFRLFPQDGSSTLRSGPPAQRASFGGLGVILRLLVSSLPVSMGGSRALTWPPSERRIGMSDHTRKPSEEGLRACTRKFGVPDGNPLEFSPALAVLNLMRGGIRLPATVRKLLFHSNIFPENRLQKPRPRRFAEQLERHKLQRM